MKKWLLFFFLFFIVIFISFNYYVYKNRTQFTKVLLEKSLNTSVDIDAVSFEDDKLILEKITIFNSAAKEHEAFSAGNITIDIPWMKFIKSYLGISRSPAHISLIDIKDSVLSIELYNLLGTDNNWSRLLKGPEEEKKSSRTFVLDKVRFTNLTVKLQGKNIAQKEKTFGPVKELVFNNITDNQPFVFVALMRVLSRELLENIQKTYNLPNITEFFESNKKMLIKVNDQIEKMKGRAQKTLSELQELLDNKEETKNEQPST